MKSFLLTFIICCLSFSVFAQKKKKTKSKVQQSYEETRVISLHDGSLMKGKIREDTDTHILLEIINGEEVKLGYKHIKKVSKPKPNHYFLDNGKSFKAKGYFSHLKFGNAFGNGSSESLDAGGFHIHSVNGYHFNPKLAVGLGLGLDVHGTNNATYSFVPIYAYAKSYPFNFKVSPYYALGLGYGAPLSQGTFWRGFYKGGYFINPSIGVRFASRKRSNFVLEMGYLIQDAYGEYTIQNWWDVDNSRFIKEDITFRRLWLNVGWIF